MKIERPSEHVLTKKLGVPSVIGASIYEAPGVTIVTSLPNRLLHLHVPKTAGTAIRVALQNSNGGSLRIFPHYDERKYTDIDPDAFDVFSGHYGYNTAKSIGGDIVTILRNPVDRFLSVYYFWRQLYNTGAEISPNTTLAAKYSLEDFVGIRDEPFMLEEFFNRITWQIAYGSSLAHRREMHLAGKTDQDIFEMAAKNIDEFAIVGIQEDLGRFGDEFRNRYGIDINVQRINKTAERKSVSDVNVRVLRQIHEWLYLDLELYAAVCSRLSEAA